MLYGLLNYLRLPDLSTFKSHILFCLETGYSPIIRNNVTAIIIKFSLNKLTDLIFNNPFFVPLLLI